jgi:hypothetical protein
LTALNLRNKNGSAFDPANYAALRTWLLNGEATNMAYMLSVQLAATKLSVFNQIDGLTGNETVDIGGYITTLNQLMADADALLAADGETLTGDPNRAAQEIAKNRLDSVNNNAFVFVKATPCSVCYPQ